MGRKPSGDDGGRFGKLQAEKDAVVRQQAERDDIEKMRSMARKTNPEDVKAKLLPVFHNYGEYGVFRDNPRSARRGEGNGAARERELEMSRWVGSGSSRCQLLDNSIW